MRVSERALSNMVFERDTPKAARLNFTLDLKITGGYMNIWAVVLVTVALVSQSAMANDSEVDQTMQQYSEALRAYNTGLMADLMHPDALLTFRNTFDAALKGPKSTQARRAAAVV